jgi:predicted ATPase
MRSEQEQGDTRVTLLAIGVDDAAHLREVLGGRHAGVIARYRELVSAALRRQHGRALDDADGATLAAFGTPLDALAAAIEIQRGLGQELWPLGVHVRARTALHSGEAAIANGRASGFDVHRALRIGAAASAGQVLLSAAARALLEGAALPAGAQLRRVGWHRLEQLHYPELLFDVVVPGLADRFPPPRSLATRPNNLPPAPAPSIGRQQALEEVTALLRGQTRLVTLTGASGSGKTRLALESAAALQDAFPDGVFLVKLAALTDPELVLLAIAQALALPEALGRSPLENLMHQLASRQLLLVIDEFEHLVSVAAALAQVLGACAGVKALVTSRTALNVRFEREYAVPPLELPRGAQTPSALGECASVQLFVERARAARSDFTLDDANAGAVAEICARLQGMPLAIELAAARIGTCTLDVLAAQLGSRLELAARAAPSVATNERSVRATVEWSFGLLDPDEKALLRRAAVFADGFALDCAGELLARAGIGPARVLELLGSVTRAGLLQRTMVDGELRLSFCEIVREHSLAQLAQCGENPELRAAHAACCIGLLERLAPQLMTRQQRAAVQRLSTESENLRAALRLAVERKDAGLLGRALQALLWFWIPQRRCAEGRIWASRALHATAGAAEARERGLILDAAAWLALFSGDHAAALQHGSQALAIAKQVGNARDVARAELALGMTHTALGRLPEGRERLTEALTRYRELGDAYGSALALLALGEAARATGDESAARPRYEEALGLLRKLGNVFWPGHLLQSLAHFRVHQGDHRSACALLAEALELGREFNDPVVVNLYVAAMGSVAIVRGKLREAVRLFAAAYAAAQRMERSFDSVDQQQLERNMAAARSSLGDEAFERAFAEGSHWTVEEAVAAAAAVRE